MPRNRLAAVGAVLASVALFLLPGAPARAAAADDFRWAVQPSSPNGPDGRTRFAYDLAPGRRVDDQVAVTNLARRPLTVTLYATDAATTVDGAFSLLPASGRPRDAGAWIKPRRGSVTVPPGRRVVVPFRLAVPASATPGDHAAGIIAAVSSRERGADGQTVSVDRRIAARVYLRVPGVLAPSVQVTAVHTTYGNPWVPFTRGAMTVTFRVRNAGNVRLGGTATVRATGPFGARLADDLRMDLPELLPGAEVELSRRLPGVLPAGMLTGDVDVDATSSVGPLPARSGAATVWRVPVTALVSALVAVLLVLRWRRRTRRPTAPVQGPADAPRRVVASS